MEEELLDLNTFVYRLNEDFITLYLIELYENAIEAYANGSQPTEENINVIKSIIIYKIFTSYLGEVHATA